VWSPRLQWDWKDGGDGGSTMASAIGLDQKAFSLAPVDDPPRPPTPRSPLTTGSVAKWHGRSDEY
jgi:hypothetical protein